MKHAVFDYNGTLGKTVDFWGDLDQHFGISEEESKDMHEKFRTGDLTGEELDDWRIESYNASEKDSSREAIETFYKKYYEKNGLREDAKELVDKFREKGFRVHLISHAPHSYVEQAAETLKTDINVKTSEIAADEEVKDIKWHLYDKSDYISGLDGDVWFFGDGRGDFAAAEMADRGFLVENIQVADYSSVDAFTGNFEDVKKRAIESLGDER